MPNRYVGVEISNSAVRVAEIAVGGTRPELIAFGQVSLPPRAVIDGAVADRSAVKAALQRCLKEGGFSQTKVHLGIAGLRAITREIDMPTMPDAELDSAVRLQALDVIPFPMEKTLLSARPLTTFVSPEGTPKRRVLIAAAHRDLVDPLLDVVRGAGLTPLSIDLTSSALVRSLGRPKGGPPGPEAIVSIGAALTTVVIHEAGVPHFVRTIASGGDAITGAISSSLDLPTSDAEAVKRNIDRPGPNMRVASAAASQASTALITEIKNSIDYYTTLPGRNEVSQVIVTGGGSRLTGFVDYLASQFRIPVVPGSCLAGIDCTRLSLTPEDLGKIDPLAAVVVGLALPDFTDIKPFDLIPPELAARDKAKRTDRVVLMAGALIVVLFVALGVWRLVEVQTAQNTENSLTNQITTLSAQRTVYDKAAAEHAQILADQDIALPLVADEAYWPEVVSTLQTSTPKDLQVLSLEATTTLPAYISPTTGPSEIQPVSDPYQLPTIDDALGVITVNVKGANYLSFLHWIEAYQNAQSGPPKDGPFLIESLSGISATAGSGQISFTSELAVTGMIHTPRFNEFELPK